MSDIKLKPCPSCGHRQPALLGYGDTYYVECVHCYLCGPRFDYDKDAAAAWNALPRHLRWTSETPTEPGWYWYRRTDGGGRSVVMLYNAYLDGRMCVYRYPEKPVPAKNFCNGDVEWAGPIPEPQEPQR